MSGPKKIDTKQLIEKIERLTKEKMRSQSVVSLDQIRSLKKPRSEPKTLLIIEDDETMRLALKRIFETEGYQIKMAADGTELSHVLDDKPIDLILLDIHLPWLNGFELAQLLKENADLKTIPLVFVSGQSKPEDIQRAFDMGADDFIKKPFEVEQVTRTVRTLLKLTESEPPSEA